VVARDPWEVARAIKQMVVRGAPAIGITAAYGLALLGEKAKDPNQFASALKALKASRPTAVNLFTALNRLASFYEEKKQDPHLPQLLFAFAQKIHREEEEASRQIGEVGARAFSGNDLILLTHCNTGALATCGEGTALAVVRALYREGRLKRVFVTETRPYLQGARLTAWELDKEEIPFTIIPDASAGFVISRFPVKGVLVGADRIAKNGDTANKIGTLTLAILAYHYHIPFYVVAPKTTLDPETSSASEIPIEERDPEEIRTLGKVPIVPATYPALNFSFDITPASLITAYICEEGIFHHPEKLFSSLSMKRASTISSRPTGIV
jgi:methylthioribose-1-phosphate isomerase